MTKNNISSKDFRGIFAFPYLQFQTSYSTKEQDPFLSLFLDVTEKVGIINIGESENDFTDVLVELPYLHYN
jgi:hypothetical protein